MYQSGHYGEWGFDGIYSMLYLQVVDGKRVLPAQSNRYRSVSGKTGQVSEIMIQVIICLIIFFFFFFFS